MSKFQNALDELGLEPKSGWQRDWWWVCYQWGKVSFLIGYYCDPRTWRRKFRLRREVRKLAKRLKKNEVSPEELAAIKRQINYKERK